MTADVIIKGWMRRMAKWDRCGIPESRKEPLGRYEPVVRDCEKALAIMGPRDVHGRCDHKPFWWAVR